MTPLTDIRAFFASKLVSYQSTDVAWENVPFDPATPSYLRFAFTQSDVNQAEYGTYGRDKRQGFVQITVLEPKGNGVGTALTKAEAIASVFHRGLSGVTNGTPVEVYKTVVGPVIGTDIHIAIPITVYWRNVTAPIGV